MTLQWYDPAAAKGLNMVGEKTVNIISNCPARRAAQRGEYNAAIEGTLA